MTCSNVTRPRFDGARRQLARPGLLITALALWAVAGAHATLVFGTVRTQPAPPPVGAPTTLTLELRDPTETPVEDAVVQAEAIPPGGEDPTVQSGRFDEVEAGRYRGRLTLDAPGAWSVRFRDTTFRQEEARATVTLEVGPGGATEPVSFIFPPTDTGPRSLSTWLVWLIGLPLAAGAIVTVMVLRSGGRADAGDADEGTPRAGGDG